MLVRRVEAASLSLRCSPVEDLRVWLSTHLAFFSGKKSPAQGQLRTVCIIGENPAWGGTERHTRELVRALLERDIRVVYISARNNAMDPELALLRPGNFEVIPVSLSVYDRGNRKAWIRLLRRIKSYVVILPCPHATFGSLSFLGALRRSFARIIYVLHASPPPLPESSGSRTSLDDRIERLRRRYRMRCASRVVTVSEAARGKLVRSWEARPDKVVTVHNGVDCEGMTADPGQRESARRRQGISRDTFVFGMVTRLSPEKGVDRALRAFARLVPEPGPELRLIIAGRGPDEAALRELARELDISERLVWRGFVDDPVSVYAVSDAFLLPSLEEGLPLSLLEAMGAGVIPVASAVGGVPEVVSDASLGWLVPSGDDEALAEAMRQVARLSPGERIDVGRRVQDRIRGSFDSRTNLAAFMEAAGLLDDATWRGGYFFSKIRDSCDAWIEFVSLWLKTHGPLTALRTRRPVSSDPLDPGAVARKPSVCLIEESHGWGGAENHTYALLEHLLERGFEVEYICGRENATVPPPGIVPIRAAAGIFDRGAEAEASWLSLFAFLESRVVVVPALDVQCGMSEAFSNALRRTFSRIIYIEHTLPRAMPPKRPKRHLNGLVTGLSLWWHRERLRRDLRMQCPTHVVAVSESVRRRFIEAWNCPPEKITTIHNGIDPSRYQGSREQRGEARRRYGVPEGALVFGMMTRLSPEKGVDLALRAFAGFLELGERAEAYLLIAGSGPEQDSLEALSAELGIEGRVRWAGFVAEPRHVYPAMDALLATSRVEGLPLALLEGMAAGAVPIVFRVGGMPEVISEPALGWVVERGDVSGCSLAMEEFANLSLSRRQAYRERVRQCIRDRFDAESANDRIVALIEGRVPELRDEEILPRALSHAR